MCKQHLFIRQSNRMFDFRRFVSFSIPSMNSIAFNQTFDSKIFNHFEILTFEFPFTTVVFLGSLQ